MLFPSSKRLLIIFIFFFAGIFQLPAQTNFKLKYTNSDIYAGIEVGSKGVKMSLVEIGANAKKNGSFNILQDTSVNTDFITFTQPTFNATLNGFYHLYNIAFNEYKIPKDRIFTAISLSLIQI